MAAGTSPPRGAGLVSEVPGGATLRVRVSAGARSDAIVGIHADALKVHMRQAPEKGKANKALTRFLATTLGTRRSDIDVVPGHTTSDKLLFLRGGDAARIRERILVILDAS